MAIRTTAMMTIQSQVDTVIVSSEALRDLVSDAPGAFDGALRDGARAQGLELVGECFERPPGRHRTELRVDDAPW
jgi:hypothetical protein